MILKSAVREVNTKLVQIMRCSTMHQSLDMNYQKSHTL